LFTFYCGKIVNNMFDFKADPEPESKRYNYIFFKHMWRFVHQPVLKIMFFLLTVLNLVLISMLKSNVQYEITNEEPPFQYFYEILLAINFVFLLEYILKLLAFTLKENFKNSVTIVDLIVTTTYFVIFGVDCGLNGKFSFGGPEFKWTNRFVFLNFLRTVKIFEAMRKNQKFKIIIDTIKSSVKLTPGYLAIMFVFIYVFAVLGLQAFAYKLTDIHTGEGTPRKNFDNLLLAILSVV